MPVTSINSAIAAYNATAKAARGDIGTGASTDSAASGPDFASMVTSGLKSALETGKQSEKLSEQAIAGKADIREVAAAVNNAEMTLQTVLAVRDKVLSAYNQIMQMPI